MEELDPGSAPPLCRLSAIEMVRGIRAGHFSSLELISACLTRIAQVNPKVNAIVTLVPEQALEAARRADEALARGDAPGPLHGLPVAHKDLQPTRGIRTTFGSRVFRDFVPEQDSLLVERTRHAGAIVVGKTNTPEFGAGSQTFNQVFGATRNPYDLTKTCGGSSGGAAVALACRMLPLADGSDMGGSLRNPAAFCNVVGLRPSPGRVPVWPAPPDWFTLNVEGPLARTVADAALFLSAIAGPDPRLSLSLEEPGALFAAPLERDFRGVHVAWWKDLGGLPVHSSIRDLVNRSRVVFESLGCIVEEAEPDFAGADEVFKTLRARWFAHLAAALSPADLALVKDTILQEVETGRRLAAADIVRAERTQARLQNRMRRFMERYQFFVLPVTQVPPFDVDQPYVTSIEGTAMPTYIDWMKSCYYISVLGTPALSVPCRFTPQGLPAGVQIVARHRDDWGLLQMGHAFEQARPEASRHA